MTTTTDTISRALDPVPPESMPALDAVPAEPLPPQPTPVPRPVAELLAATLTDIHCFTGQFIRTHGVLCDDGCIVVELTGTAIQGGPDQMLRVLLRPELMPAAARAAGLEAAV